MKLHALIAVAMTMLASGAGAAGAQTVVDLALVLAVDGSSSIDEREFRLQMQGYARAFRHPHVVDAMTTGPARRVAVTMVQWSNLHDQSQVIDWTILDGPDAAARFADAIERAPRAVPPGSTSISGAIEYAARLLGDRRIVAARRVIDVSGDGLNNMGRQPSYARDRAVEAGVIVNGLAITTEVPALDIYFEDNVIGGTGSFALAVDSFEAFPEAILKKLMREIVWAPTADVIAAAPAP
ncbi:MAG: DUF1194 domain-containing protein [Alphaproteobacteria bacterium]|nr:DUF1194 domain-containing protein [Alphaproteobacteria bacterium]